MKRYEVGVNHAVKQYMLKREIDFHLDAVRQLFENIERFNQLWHAVDKGDILIRLITTLKSVRMNDCEVFESFLGLCIALRHVLL